MADRAIVLTGPTASGKTRLGILVAERVGGEIISADSRQVYRGMNIGTAKATTEERDAAPHHGLDLVDPDQRYSAGRFARDARGWIAGTRDRGRVPLLVGGTGFFLRALLDPLFEEPALDPSRRERLRQYLGALGDAGLREWLALLDPIAAARLQEGGGRQRMLRALEIALLTGRPLHWWHRSRPGAQPPLDAAVFVLDLPRDELYQRINARVGAMVEAGLVEEVRALLSRGYNQDDPGMSATGYPEILDFFAGRTDLDEAVDRIRRATRRYARRQLTWFRNQLPAGAIWLDGTRDSNDLADQVVRLWQGT